MDDWPVYIHCTPYPSPSYPKSCSSAATHTAFQQFLTVLLPFLHIQKKMGRPLFSQAHSTPAVRTEPDPFLSYERWTHWNPFDPDSEEFFQNDPVFEAFLDPSIISPSGEEEQAMVVDEAISSGSSEGSVSERGSPMAVGSDDPMRMLAEAYPSVNWGQHMLAGQSPPTTADFRPLDASPPYTSRYNPITPGFARNRPRSATLTVLPQGLPSASHRSFMSANPTDNLPRTSNITPISIPSRATPANYPPSPATPQSPFIPATPPSQVMPLGQATQSPPPSGMPRMTWASRQPMATSSPPPINGPLTNASARMSLAHIVPTLIRVRDVVM